MAWWKGCERDVSKSLLPERAVTPIGILAELDSQIESLISSRNKDVLSFSCAKDAEGIFFLLKIDTIHSIKYFVSFPDVTKTLSPASTGEYMVLPFLPPVSQLNFLPFPTSPA